MKEEKIGLGGSCHWCTEAVFQSLNGVSSVDQGWISAVEADSFSEAVIVHFDPSIIPVEVLVEVHLHTHNSTADHSMRKKYRSAVYSFTEDQRKAAEEILKKFQDDFSEPLVTKSLILKEFRTSEETFRNYYLKNPDKPFCKSYIDLKLKLVLEKFSAYNQEQQVKSH